MSIFGGDEHMRSQLQTHSRALCMIHPINADNWIRDIYLVTQRS
jgi:hypothetical protein